MESLLENKPLLYSLLSSGAAVFALASGISPDFTAKLELVEFQPEVSMDIFTLCVLGLYFFGPAFSVALFLGSIYSYVFVLK